MKTIRPHHEKEEFARLGDEIYERAIAGQFGASDTGKFAAIDIDTGEYEIDADELAASDRLSERLPNAQIWLRRIGTHYARRFGGASRPRAS